MKIYCQTNYALPPNYYFQNGGQKSNFLRRFLEVIRINDHMAILFINLKVAYTGNEEIKMNYLHHQHLQHDKVLS